MKAGTAKKSLTVRLSGEVYALLCWYGQTGGPQRAHTRDSLDAEYRLVHLGLLERIPDLSPLEARDRADQAIEGLRKAIKILRSKDLVERVGEAEAIIGDARSLLYKLSNKTVRLSSRGREFLTSIDVTFVGPKKVSR